TTLIHHRSTLFPYTTLFRSRATREAATPSMVAVLKALLGPAMALERQQTWSEDYTLHIQTDIILPGHPAWQTRELLLTRVKGLLDRKSTRLNSSHQIISYAV